jgi:hypothetical protein
MQFGDNLLNIDDDMSDDSAEDLKRRQTFNQIDSAHHKNFDDGQEEDNRLINASESAEDHDRVATNVQVDDTPRAKSNMDDIFSLANMDGDDETIMYDDSAKPTKVNKIQ